MATFSATIHKFEKNGEKTGWRYIDISSEIAQELAPGVKKSFRVKGTIDHIQINGVSVLPVGGGQFILALKSDLRKQLRKGEGSTVTVNLIADKVPYILNEDMMACLHDSPEADSFFQHLQHSHQRYFSKWIDSAKTDVTRAKRIAQVVRAMQLHLSYSEMIRSNQDTKL